MNKWLEDVITNRALEMENEKKNPGWFSITAITKVPYIAYPTLNEAECKEIQEQTKEVLRISRNKNQYKEVAITYNIHNHNPDKYKIVLGNIANVEICNDTNTLQLLQTSSVQEELAVISIHNHPNDSMFSINDLLIFAEHPSIKIMEIVNRDGEVAFLLRPKFEKYHSLIDILIDAEPNFLQKMRNFHQTYPNQDIKISSLIPDVKIRKEIIRSMIELLESQGVYVHNYVNQEQAKKIDFSTFTTNYSLQGKITNNDSKINLKDDYLYLKNGEDDYEWEER